MNGAKKTKNGNPLEKATFWDEFKKIEKDKGALYKKFQSLEKKSINIRSDLTTKKLKG